MKLKKMKVKKDVPFRGAGARKIRGSSLYDLAAHTDTARRIPGEPSDASYNLGFRPFRSLK